MGEMISFYYIKWSNQI